MGLAILPCAREHGHPRPLGPAVGLHARQHVRVRLDDRVRGGALPLVRVRVGVRVRVRVGVRARVRVKIRVSALSAVPPSGRPSTARRCCSCWSVSAASMV